MFYKETTFSLFSKFCPDLNKLLDARYNGYLCAKYPDRNKLLDARYNSCLCAKDVRISSLMTKVKPRPANRWGQSNILHQWHKLKKVKNSLCKIDNFNSNVFELNIHCVYWKRFYRRNYMQVKFLTWDPLIFLKVLSKRFQLFWILCEKTNNFGSL